MTGKIREYQFNAQGGISSTAFITTPSVSGGSTVWGDITGEVSTQADIYATITSRALISTLSSAAYTLLTDYATSTQGLAVSSKAAIATLSSAAYTLLTDYATSTQGNAVSSKAATSTLSSAAYMASTVFAAVATISSAAYTVSSIYATSSQGTKADAAAPSATLSSAAYTLATNYASSTHNISSATHTFPGGTTNFLRADGTFATPPAGASNISTVKLSTVRITTTTSTFALTELAFTVSNTLAYAFDFGVLYAAAISSTGLRLGMQYATASSFSANVRIPAVVATGTDSETQGNIIVSGSSVVAPSTPLTTTMYFANVYGSMVAAANGTLQLTYATEVAGSAISTFAGSYGILTTL